MQREGQLLQESGSRSNHLVQSLRQVFDYDEGVPLLIDPFVEDPHDSRMITAPQEIDLPHKTHETFGLGDASECLHREIQPLMLSRQAEHQTSIGRAALAEWFDDSIEIIRPEARASPILRSSESGM
jgi:hypothetical protein